MAKHSNGWLVLGAKLAPLRAVALRSGTDRLLSSKQPLAAPPAAYVKPTLAPCLSMTSDPMPKNRNAKPCAGPALFLVAMLSWSSVTAAPAGITPGSFSVSSSGAATFTVPIAVPQGIGGLEPHLSLAYDSQAGRGIASTGWSLQGVPSIKRCPQTKRQDGRRQGITLTNADRFCFEGQRLVLDGAALAYGADGAIYRTELDSFARVTSLGEAGGGPASFRVETKSGLTMELGATSNSRWLPAPAVAGGTQPAAVAMWAVNKVRDRVGNEVIYSYDSDSTSGTQLLSRIEYNRGQAYVQFSYVDDANPRIAFIAGTRVSHPKLLDKVRTYVLDGAVERLVKTYSLAYDFADVRGGFPEGAVARLKSVTECAAGDDQCLRPITFEWAAWTTGDRSFATAYQAGAGSAFSGAPWTDDRVKYRRFTDLNKDGKLDIIGFGEDGVYVLLSRPGFGSSSFEDSPVKVTSDFGNSPNTWWDMIDASIRPRHVVDMNRDGHADIVGFNNVPQGHQGSPLASGIYLAEWDPVNRRYGSTRKVEVQGGDVFTTNWGSRCAYAEGDWTDLTAPKHLVDMNADGFPDLVAFGRDGVLLSLWDGTRFGTPRLVLTSTFRMERGYPPNYWLTGDCMGTDRQPIFLEDMNGDGFADIVGAGVDGIFVSIWDVATQMFIAPGSPFTGMSVGFRKDPFYPVHMADLNGDGYPDLVQFGPSGITAALWNGKTFNPASTWTTSLSGGGWEDHARNPRRIADVNGDGFPDIVGFANDGVYVAISNGRDGFATATRWTPQFPSNTTDSTGNAWGRANIDSPRYIVDMNGDGVPDIVGLGSASVRWASPSAAPGTRITKITDSLGAATNVRYSLAQQFSSSYANDLPASTWPVRDANGPTLIVTEVARDNGVGGTRKTRYRYGGRKVHFDDGTLGFSWSAARDDSTGIEAYTAFEQTWPHTGQAKLSETYRSTLTGEVTLSGCATAFDLCFKNFTVTKSQPLLSRSTVTLAHESLGSAGENQNNTRWFLFANRVHEERWELDGSALPTKTTMSEYEEPRLVGGSKQWGNLTRKSVVIDDGHSSVTNNSFEPAVETSWTLGRLRTTTVTTTRPARTISVPAPSDAAPPTGAAGPLPISPAVLSAILSLLLDD
jgi:hypothetical protein